MASDQSSTAVGRDVVFPTRGRRRMVNGPLVTNLPAELPFLAARQRLDTSSDDLGEERIDEQEPKRLRSTSTTPRSESARAWAPHDYDNIMGIGPVSTLSDEETDSERADLEGSDDNKSLEGSPQMVPNPSGVDESLKGHGSASFEEALEF